jgi:hypothetical protein
VFVTTASRRARSRVVDQRASTVDARCAHRASHRSHHTIARVALNDRAHALHDPAHALDDRAMCVRTRALQNPHSGEFASNETRIRIVSRSACAVARIAS